MNITIFITQPALVAKNATLGHPAGNRTRDLASLVRCSVNWATKVVAKSMATSSVFDKVVHGGDVDVVKGVLNGAFWRLHSTANN